jgi:hypothetical protein
VVLATQIDRPLRSRARFRELSDTRLCLCERHQGVRLCPEGDPALSRQSKGPFEPAHGFGHGVAQHVCHAEHLVGIHEPPWRPDPLRQGKALSGVDHQGFGVARNLLTALEVGRQADIQGVGQSRLLFAQQVLEALHRFGQMPTERRDGGSLRHEAEVEAQTTPPLWGSRKPLEVESIHLPGRAEISPTREGVGKGPLGSGKRLRETFGERRGLSRVLEVRSVVARALAQKYPVARREDDPPPEIPARFGER